MPSIKKSVGNPKVIELPLSGTVTSVLNSNMFR